MLDINQFLKYTYIDNVMVKVKKKRLNQNSINGTIIQSTYSELYCKIRF